MSSPLEVGKKYRTNRRSGWVEVLKDTEIAVAVVDDHGCLCWVDKKSRMFLGTPEIPPFVVTGEMKPPVKYSIDFFAPGEVAADPNAELSLGHYLIGYAASSWSDRDDDGYRKYRVTVESIDE
jgi:hypothetical protein